MNNALYLAYENGGPSLTDGAGTGSAWQRSGPIFAVKSATFVPVSGVLIVVAEDGVWHTLTAVQGNWYYDGLWYLAFRVFNGEPSADEQALIRPFQPGLAVPPDVSPPHTTPDYPASDHWAARAKYRGI